MCATSECRSASYQAHRVMAQAYKPLATSCRAVHARAQRRTAPTLVRQSCRRRRAPTTTLKFGGQDGALRRRAARDTWPDRGRGRHEEDGRLRRAEPAAARVALVTRYRYSFVRDEVRSSSDLVASHGATSATEVRAPQGLLHFPFPLFTVLFSLRTPPAQNLLFHGRWTTFNHP